MLYTFSAPGFYNRWIHLSAEIDPVSPFIAQNPKLFPFFENACGAMNDSQLDVSLSEEDRESCRNQKGGVTQIILACCSFDLLFQYILSEWEGSATDALLYQSAQATTLLVIPGKYYLADAGFGECDALLVPYHGVCYHLKEWARGDTQWVTDMTIMQKLMIL